MANGAVYVGQWRGDLRDGFGKQAGRDEVRMKWKRLSSLRSSLEAVPKHSVIESKSLGFEFKSTCAEPDSGQVALTFWGTAQFECVWKGITTALETPGVGLLFMRHCKFQQLDHFYTGLFRHFTCDGKHFVEFGSGRISTG